jgi:hypothetical protein
VCNSSNSSISKHCAVGMVLTLLQAMQGLKLGTAARTQPTTCPCVTTSTRPAHGLTPTHLHLAEHRVALVVEQCAVGGDVHDAAEAFKLTQVKGLAKVVAALEGVKVGKAVHDLDAMVKVWFVIVLQHL